MRVFHAKAPRARLGIELTRRHDTPFIGREIDLSLLKGIFDKTVAANSVQLVTIVGEPGLGKSRIVAELFTYIDTRTDLITWRQGRCLPYGEGITFWALGEVLKAHTGILESDPPDVASAKLDTVLPEGNEREWFRQRLLPLLGIEASSSAEREELFTAWRRFIEQIAEGGSTVLVFEDLHWADSAMLAFLEHLADMAEGVPLLVIGTARPELFERHPDFAAGMRNANTINLTPLAPEETARLISALLKTTVIPTELQQPIIERAGGNPLYAEEFVRLLRDKDLLVKKGTSWDLREGAEVPFPDSVRALIAARLDTLGSDAKSLLADAAVVGKVFWAGALAEMGGRDLQGVTDSLRELSRKELIRPARRSSIEGEAEHVFWHILTRDIAYAQLPRASRASRHVAAAAWIESQARGRVEDLADVLAYHYATALDLVRASGQADQAAALESPALRFLTLAGDRALGLNTAAALTNFERALALAPPGHPDRPEALARFGEAALDGGRGIEAADALEEAIEAFRQRGDFLAAARAMFVLVQVLSSAGDPRTFELGAEALAILEPLPAGQELVGALIEVSRARVLGGVAPAEGVSFADRALDLAAELGLPLPARALGYRGLARCDLGDAGGLADMRQALQIAIDAGQGREAATIYNNLGRMLWKYEGPTSALAAYREGISFDEARGLASMGLWIEGASLDALADSGEFDAVLLTADRLTALAETSGNLTGLSFIRSVQVWVWALRGEARHAVGLLERWEAIARETGVPEVLASVLASFAIAHMDLGQLDRAALLLDELAATPHLYESVSAAAWLSAMGRAALQIGRPELALGLLNHVDVRTPYAQHALVSVHAALAEADGEIETALTGYEDASGRWERFGVVPEQGFALLGQGRCLLGLVRPIDAVPVLQRAREIFERLGAAPALAETDALLQQATPLRS